MKTFEEYEDMAMRTAKVGGMEFDLIHAALGLCGEAGEFADAVKKKVVYKKPLDSQNCIEELGDILWYVALACDVLNISMDEVADFNVKKLALRYPEKYSDICAIERADKK